MNDEEKSNREQREQLAREPGAPWPFPASEEDRIAIYQASLASGLSDDEAREDAWPADGGEPHTQ